MREILLGKEGGQPFKISDEHTGVSRHHAKVTIFDDGRWTLEDLNSTNGTSVRRQSDGQMVAVGNVDITPMTFIQLGPDNSLGCGFYARQILGENYGTFLKEYEYLNNMCDKYDASIEKVEKKIKLIRWSTPVISLLIVVLSVIGERSGWLSGSDNLLLLRMGPLLTSVIVAMFDGRSLIRKKERERDRFMRCPNPLCYHRLKTSDVRNMRCPKCRK